MSDQNPNPRPDANEPASEANLPLLSRRGVLAGSAALGFIAAYDPRDAPNNVVAAQSSGPIDIGSRLELFIDDYLIDQMDGVEQRLNPPQRQDIVIEHDEPWEGGGCGYHTVFEDDGTYRMYYQSNQIGIGIEEDSHRLLTSYAESDDGINWEKPSLGLHEFDGSTDNNIIWDSNGDSDGAAHNFTPFKDENPNAAADAQYKAIGGVPPKPFKSSDGIHWEKIQDQAILSEDYGRYDSQNLVFWDTVEKEYRAYFRAKTDDWDRLVKTARSDDFLNWTDVTELTYPDSPFEQMYTNVIKPYYRAPHIKLGFPARYVERDWDSQSMKELPGWDFRQSRANEGQERYGSAVTDTLFMSSRGSETFYRWPRAFIRPGLWNHDSHSNWKYGDNYTAWQLVETESTIPDKPRELSLYAIERYWTSDARLRRFTLRLDGFISMQAPLDGGEFVTAPVQFDGDDLVVNYSTSAAGSIRVELQDADGQPYQGFSLSDSPELFGDDLDRTVEWTSGANVGDLAGQSVRLRFVMSDADLYSFQFTSSEGSDPQREPTCRDAIHSSHDAGLVGHYELEDVADDGAVADSSGLEHHGTNVGATPVAGGQVGGAFDFDGTSYVNVGYPLLLDSTGSATVSGWFKTTNSDDYMGIFGHRSGLNESGGGLMFRTTPDGFVQVTVNGYDSGAHPVLGHSFAFDDGSWHHLAAVYDGTEVRMYVDGTEVDSASYSEPLEPYCPPFEIGRYQWVDKSDDVYYFSGLIDDVRVYNEALSASEVQSLASMN